MKNIVIPIVLSVLGTHIQLWVMTYKKYAKEKKIEKNNISAILSFTKEEFGNIINSYLCTLAGFIIIYYTDDKKTGIIVPFWGNPVNIILIFYFLIGFFSSFIVDVLNSKPVRDKIKKRIENNI